MFKVRPGRTVASAAAVALLVGIVLNATMMQSGPHPAPLFGGAREVMMTSRPIELPSMPVPTAAPMPVPRPSEALVSQPALPVVQQTTPAPPSSIAAILASRAQPHVVEPAPAPAATVTKDQIASLLRTEPVAEASAQPAARIAAVQKALKKAGYVLRPDGVMHNSTRQALEMFEREHKLPVTGELTPRTLRELTAQSGVAIP